MKRIINIIVIIAITISSQLYTYNPIVADDGGHTTEFTYDESCNWPSYRGDNFNTAYKNPPCAPECFDVEGPNTLQEIWSYPTFGDTLFPPSLDFGKVYLGDKAGWFYCIDAFNGQLSWQRYTGSAIEVAPTLFDSGDVKDPYRKRVFYGDVAGNFYCRDALTGRLVWSYNVDNPIRCSPKVYGGRVYFATDCGNIYCYDAVVPFPYQYWNYYLGNSTTKIRGTFAAGFDHLWFGASDNKLYCLKDITSIYPIIPLGWPITTGTYTESVPVYDNGFIYYAAADLYCVNAFSGTILYADAISPSFITHLAIEPLTPSPSILYVGTSDNNVRKYSALPLLPYLAPIGTPINLPKIYPINSSPSITNDKAFVTSKSATQHLLCVLKAGFPSINIPVPGPALFEKLTSISIAYKNLYFCRNSCEIYCYGCKCETKYTITVTPKYVCKTKGTLASVSFQLTAQVFNENGTLANISPPFNPSIGWTIEPNLAGAVITQTGLFTAWVTGKWIVTARYTYLSSNGSYKTIYDHATIEIKP